MVDRVEATSGCGRSQLRQGRGRVQSIVAQRRPLFQFGPLDQGWWPDGLYTAPTDEALRYDIEVTKQLGFNMIRKHVKVEPDRWYYSLRSSWACSSGRTCPAATSTSDGTTRTRAVAGVGGAVRSGIPGG